MATLTQQEKNTLRRVVRLLDMRENRGKEQYEHVAQGCLTELREMLLPTEQYVLHVPDEYAFELKVVWFETRSDGKKHLFLQVIEETNPVQEDGHPQPERPQGKKE